MAKINCSECGCPYDSDLVSCPECGCPNNSRQITEDGYASVCPHCGAPNGGFKICQYCDSAIPYIGAPQTTIINNQNNGSTGLAAFGGALLGSLLDDLL